MSGAFDYAAWLERKRAEHGKQAAAPSPEKAVQFNRLLRRAGVGHSTIANWMDVGREQVRYGYASKGAVPPRLMAFLETLAAAVETLQAGDDVAEPFDEAAACRDMIENDKRHFGSMGRKVEQVPVWFWQRAYGEVEGLEQARLFADADTVRQIGKYEPEPPPPPHPATRPPRVVLHLGLECDVDEETGMFFDPRGFKERHYTEAQPALEEQEALQSVLADLDD